MIKIIKYIFIIITIIGVFFLGRYSIKPKDTIRIVKETKTEYIIKKVPITHDDFVNCYKSQLEIFGTMKDNWMHIIAKDDCKESRKSFKLESETKSYGLVAGVQVGVGLTRPFNPNIYIGVGVTYGFLFFAR